VLAPRMLAISLATLGFSAIQTFIDYFSELESKENIFE
jgi:hypothetical protein